MIEDADFDEKSIIPITPPIAAPIFTSTPKITLSPSPCLFYTSDAADEATIV